MGNFTVRVYDVDAGNLETTTDWFTFKQVNDLSPLECDEMLRAGRLWFGGGAAPLMLVVRAAYTVRARSLRTIGEIVERRAAARLARMRGEAAPAAVSLRLGGDEGSAPVGAVALGVVTLILAAVLVAAVRAALGALVGGL